MARCVAPSIRMIGSAETGTVIGACNSPDGGEQEEFPACRVEIPLPRLSELLQDVEEPEASTALVTVVVVVGSAGSQFARGGIQLSQVYGSEAASFAAPWEMKPAQ